MRLTSILSILALALVYADGIPCGAQEDNAPSTYEPYAFTTFAGKDPGRPDGTGSNARFTNPRSVAVDSAGNVYVAETENNTIRKVTSLGVVTTLAGLRNTSGSADGTGTEARFGSPSGVAVDGAGNVYVADFGNNTIRKVTPTGVVTTLAGLAGNEGDANGAGNAARFHLYYVSGVAVDSAGNVYVADSLNFSIRKVTPAGVVTTLARGFQFPSGVAVDSAGNVYVADVGIIRKVTPTGTVTTLAGLAGSLGSADGTGNVARFNLPRSVAADNAGNVYVADTDNHTIRKVTPAGVVTTLAGLFQLVAGGFPAGGYADGVGSEARFSHPSGVAVDSAGNAYVADIDNNTIRKVTPVGLVTTLAGLADSAGGVDGTGSEASFSLPRGMAVDAEGNAYVADSGSHTIRKVTPAGAVTTLAGLAGSFGSADGTGSAARFYLPSGVAVGTAGTVYVADSYNFTIRKVTPGGVATTLAGLAGSAGSADGAGSDARFGYSGPAGLAVDGAGNVYVADPGNRTIRKVTPAGAVTTLAGLADSAGDADGTGSDARFNAPTGVALDSAGNVYVTDSGTPHSSNSTIRKVTPSGVVTTLAGLAQSYGSADGTGSDARFRHPTGVAVDSAGNVYVVDSGNSTIRKMTATGVVTTLAGLVAQYDDDGSGRIVTGGSGSADGTGSDARFSFALPFSGGAVDGAGNLYVADTANNTIRKGYPALRVLNSGFDGRKFVLSLTGQVGRSVAFETSTDLVHWLPLSTASFWIGQITMGDPDASDFPRRFYRVFYGTNSPAE